jgi:hypothetical protein
MSLEVRKANKTLITIFLPPTILFRIFSEAKNNYIFFYIQRDRLRTF